MKLLLLFHTLRYLKWQQIYFRVYRKIKKPLVSEIYNPSSVRLPPSSWVAIELYPRKISTAYVANFLNEKMELSFPEDWNREGVSKLWTYNLHYFEDLLSDGADNKREFHRELLDRWIADNHVGQGNGWEPYPTSLRVVNVLKAWLAGLTLPEVMLGSVHAQASYLSNDLEKHLLGNHLFENYKALLFAGLVFGEKHWILTSVQGLAREVQEQILEDGGNFELSPMYHALILVGMLDLVNVCRAYSCSETNSFMKLVSARIPKMLRFLSAMSHPDGAVSFFNDSVRGIAPENNRIFEYASSLGFEIEEPSSQVDFFDGFASGYYSATTGCAKIIYDVSRVGPDYIPGHAHADTLSFELSIGIERVFVNSGTSVYGRSQLRHMQRKTCSHNTVEVDGRDSSQVWSGFRVAKRADILHRSSSVDEVKGLVVMTGAHNGYKGFTSGCNHSRKISVFPNKLLIIDKLEGKFSNAVSRYFFHPDLKVLLVAGKLSVRGECFELTSDLTGCSAILNRSKWYPEFGKSFDSVVLEVTFVGNTSGVEFFWEKY